MSTTLFGTPPILYIIEVSKYDYEVNTQLLGHIDETFSSKKLIREYIKKFINVDKKDDNLDRYTQRHENFIYYFDIIEFKNEILNLEKLTEYKEIYEPVFLFENDDEYDSFNSSTSSSSMSKRETKEMLKFSSVSPSLTDDCGTLLTQKFSINNTKFLISYIGECIDKSVLYHFLIDKIHDLKRIVICHEHEHHNNYTHVLLLFYSPFITKRKDFFNITLNIREQQKIIYTAVYKQTQNQYNTVLHKFHRFDSFLLIKDFAENSLPKKIVPKKEKTKRVTKSKKNSNSCTTSSDSDIAAFEMAKRKSLSAQVQYGSSSSQEDTSIYNNNISFDPPNKESFKISIPTVEDVKKYIEKQKNLQEQNNISISNPPHIPVSVTSPTLFPNPISIPVPSSTSVPIPEVESSSSIRIVKQNCKLTNSKWQQDLIQELKNEPADDIIYYVSENQSTKNIYNQFVEMSRYLSSTSNAKPVMIKQINEDSLLKLIINSCENHTWDGKILLILIAKEYYNDSEYKNIFEWLNDTLKIVITAAFINPEDKEVYFLPGSIG